MAQQEKQSFGSEFQLKEELDDEDVESNAIGNDPTEIITSVNPFNGYPVRQENGQRKTGPPPDWPTTRHPPSRGCEVFVGKLPRDCFEAELFPLFERCGPIYEMRLMMDFSGFNRGYAFITYQSRDDAKKSVKELNNFEMRLNRLIGVCQSVDNCRLFVGGIPKTKKREEILEEMCKISEGVVDVIVYPSAHDKTKNRGFAFVEYESHRSAAMARRKLLPGKIQLWGHQIAVDWAEPEAEVDEDVMATVRVLYVRNLMMTTTEEQIKEIFDQFKANSVERVKKLKDYAFVHFRERDDALNAMNRMNGREIDGSIVEVTLAKPVDKNQYFRFTRGVSPSNIPFALSPNAGSPLDLTALPYLTIPSTLNTLTPKNVRRPVHLPSNLNGTVRSATGPTGNLLHHRGAYYTILRPTARRTEMPPMVAPGSIAFAPGTSLFPHPLLNAHPFVNGSYSNSSLLFANGSNPCLTSGNAGPATFAYPIVFAPSYPPLSAVDSSLINYSSINSFGQSTFSN